MSKIVLNPEFRQILTDAKNHFQITHGQPRVAIDTLSQEFPDCDVQEFANTLCDAGVLRVAGNGTRGAILAISDMDKFCSLMEATKEITGVAADPRMASAQERAARIEVRLTELTREVVELRAELGRPVN